MTTLGQTPEIAADSTADHPLSALDENSAWTLDDMSPDLHEAHQCIALTSMVVGGSVLIQRARPHIRLVDFQGVYRTICATLLGLSDSHSVVTVDTFESAFRAVDDTSDISDFLTRCRRLEREENKWPGFVEYETLLDFLRQIEASPTALYFWYDADDVLLYIGITSDVAVRHASHTKRSSWSAFADHWTVQRFLTRERAEAAEAEAIRTLKPVFNRVHNDTPEAAERMRTYLIKHGRADLLMTGIKRG